MGIKSSNLNMKLNMKVNVGLNMGLNFAISCLVSLLIAGCGESLKPLSAKSHTWQESLQKTWDGIFANRPQNRTHFIALYQLKNPALLEALDDGKVNPALAQKIEQEQNAFIAAAKKLSADVQVLYRYRLVLNAVALMAPNGISKNLSLLDLAQQMETSGTFARPQEIAGAGAAPNELQLRNSVKFIGADVAHEMGVRGQGMKVGIIDTGIDYTHAMFGGPGTEAAYKSVDPSQNNALFPSQKVVGGIDLVGTEYNSDSDNFNLRIPKPDPNPLDEAGHGTHVAGTVAGVGDGSATYSGVAPDASLYAIKVFGADGSTSDEVVIAGLEFAADPSGDLNLSDRLDVVNLSLGSPYGTGHIFYARAVCNMSRAGTVVVASAGNSGAKQYIVGAPSVAEDAISVAASVDNADHNWKFSASEFTAVVTGQKFLTEAVESPIAKPISEVGDLKGTLVFAGLANAEFAPELVAALQGHVALIDRGAVTFAEKMKRAEAAGAVGVVVVNNQDGAPFAMGGDGDVKIPAIMIAKTLGTQLKSEMAKGEVAIQFKTEARIEKPQLIDTLTDFSSQGPRSLDSLIKPEISSPGMNVISAKMGGGSQGVSMSGTSMAGPHVAGVMALLKQTHPQLSSQELKSLLMGTSVTIQDEEKSRYPISRQGAGRVQIDRALQGVLISSKPSLSLGEVSLDQIKILEKEFSLKNISGRGLQLSLRWDGSANVKVLTQQVSLAPNQEELSLKIAFSLSSEGLKENINQLDGWIKLYEGVTEVHRIPVLAMVRLVSQLQVKKLAIDSTSAIDAFASPAHLQLANQSSQAAKVLLLNSLGVDPRKTGVVDSARSRACDLQAAGYRFSGGKLQVAVKTYEPLTTWNTCEISIQLDMNNDGVADQELVGVPADHLAGMVGSDPKSILLDAGMTREIRREYEAQVMSGDKTVKPNYMPAIQGLADMLTFEHSTIAMVQIDLAQLKLSPTGELAVKIATTNTEDYAIEQDDFLKLGPDQWMKIDSTENGQAYMNLPEFVTVPGKSSLQIDFQRGMGSQGLLILVPTNVSTLGALQKDQQMLTARPSYLGQ